MKGSIRHRSRAGSICAQRRNGFTLIEVLVVVSIIALLVSILLPALKRAREQSNGVVCQSNMHQLLLGMHTYVADNRVLPGTDQVWWSAWEDSGKPAALSKWPTWKASDSWLGLRDPEQSWNTDKQDQLWAHIDATVPRGGSLYKYVKNEKVYLCPKDQKGFPEPSDPAGGGGNGRFSYTMDGLLGFKSPDNATSFKYVANFQQLPGVITPAPYPSIKTGTKVQWTASKMVTLMEEHPFNNTNHGWPGDSWAADSYLALRHLPLRRQGKCNFAYLDGHTEPRRYSYDIGSGATVNTLQGVDIWNELRIPYSWANNTGGTVNEKAFLHPFDYPYAD